MRDTMAILIAPALRATGFRFGKAWRQAESNTVRGFIWSHVLNTTYANICADYPRYCQS